MNAPDFILDSAKVIAHFGEWPDFHDMDVALIHMNRRGPEAPAIEFVIIAWA